MERGRTILLLEDEPLILMDLEFAAQDCGCSIFSAASCAAALKVLEADQHHIDVAVLDVSLGGESTCFPVADRLDQVGIPYLLHSGDLDRHNERVRQLQAELIAKPAAAETVIGAAIALSQA